MTELDEMFRSEVGSLALELARITGLVVVCPLLWIDAPKRTRAAIVVLFTFLVHGQGKVAPGIVGRPDLAVIGIFGELALGAAMGFVVRLVLSIAEVTANAASPLIGFGIAQVFNPATGDEDTVLNALLQKVALLIALITGLHHVVIGTLLASFQAVPVGTIIAPGKLYPLFLEASSSVLNTGVRLALPLMAVVFMVQIALGFVSRAAPAMQIFSVGFAFTLVTGGVVLSLMLPDFARELAGELSFVGSRMEATLALARGP
ncbi:MAG TPA: flagellar biosynthetic protein FliR [Polyangiaceae bacterium]|nr:flagellar biosynthetic protein FliR [Polyangiaceae bacterium]